MAKKGWHSRKNKDFLLKEAKSPCFYWMCPKRKTDILKIRTCENYANK